METGALAQMNYNTFAPNSNGSLGLPGSGFASRGKGSHIKRLSVIPPKISTVAEDDQSTGVSTPRTSRSHLLAGLRTAPKTYAVPPSAPPTQLRYNMNGMDGRRNIDQDNTRARAVPQTATASSFSNAQRNRYSGAMNTPMYSLPEQVLAPPALQVGDQGEEHMDPNLYAELMATNLYLAQQQQRLQQQLLNVTAAAQQFQGLNINNQMGMVQPNYGGQNIGFYNQQGQNNMQPIISPVPGAQPGLYSVYDPMTGQQSLFIDPNAQNQQAATTPPAEDRNPSPPHPETPLFKAQISPPPPVNSTMSVHRNPSPPKSVSPPQASPMLPPPSANAFRRGHKKATSLASCVNANSAAKAEGPKTGVPKSTAFPPTPMTGTFGPGQARSGEHPVRQPRGPPPMEELLAKPNADFEGSKNFASRRRRLAVNNLVRAGIERRSGRAAGSAGSAGSLTPPSETDITFSIGSDDDNGSGSLSSKPSIGSLRAEANGAIGSERKKMQERSRERESVGSQHTTASLTSDEGKTVGGKLVDLKVDSSDLKFTEERRKTPMLVLTSAEKRKSSLF
ncbi:MAG: hypothetical protein M1824_004311 [Vezdaea acicularis]|nr:MAG: hypothetical protein M1824_004311 [Vezdaea acicularis]